MKAHGDYEAVNLRTGAKYRRVVGDGRSELADMDMLTLIRTYVRIREIAAIESLRRRPDEALEWRALALFQEIETRLEPKGVSMHYRNGREAKNGDKIVQIGGYGTTAEITAVGVLYDAKPGNDHCNGAIAPIQHPQTSACLCDCLHVDDLAALLKEAGLDKRPPGK